MRVWSFLIASCLLMFSAVIFVLSFMGWRLALLVVICLIAIEGALHVVARRLGWW